MTRSLSRTAGLSAGLSAGLILIAGPALADGDIPTPVQQVVVTATRLPSRVDQTPDLYVIDSQELELRDAMFADEALATVPGVTVAGDGAFGGVTSAFLRGMGSDKTLVLIDGVPVDDPSLPAGGFDFSTLDLFDVQRIEVLTGPQGSLWGSDAIGGVISITSREPDGLRAAVEGGSFATARAGVATGVSRDAYAFGLSLSGLRTDGIPKAAGTSVDDPFSTWTGTLNGRARLTDRIAVDGKLTFDQGRAFEDGFPPPAFALGVVGDLYKTESVSGFVRVKAKGLLGLDQELTVLGADGLRVSRCGNSAYYCDTPYKYRGARDELRWTAGLGSADTPYAVNFGVERKDERARLSDSSSKNLGETSAFVVGRIDPVHRLSTTLSVRYDAPDSYRSVVTGRAGAVLDLGRGFRATATWGQGFKTPTISELACDFCFPAGPAPNLKPERAEGEDAGLGWRSADGRFDLTTTWYRLEVHDQIEYASTFPYRYVNVERVRSQGIESQATVSLKNGLYARASYAYTDARDETTGSAQLRIPRNQGSLVLGWTGARAHAAVTLRAEGEAPDVPVDGSFTPETVARPGFATADLAAGVKLTRNLEATLTVRNFTDQRWQEVFGYAEPGAWAMAGLRLRY
jgi:vitamin B12 transporter